ncbi:MAG: type II secretion system major pseudopilin GspG [Gemmatimonadota bacterium]|jgi:general secretion pathway protein G|nr:type II secretion system major pseudopilin GspG [Gemmatimonadota bacterium]
MSTTLTLTTGIADLQAPDRRVADLRSSGFTLIELLVVVAIIGTLAALVGPALFRNIGDARSTAARAQIETFALALDAYLADNHSYPSDDQGLEALRTLPERGDHARTWRGPYLRKVVPMDPWGRPYIYRSPGLRNPESYDLYTLGRDGTPGGVEEDADITSWGGPVGP